MKTRELLAQVRGLKALGVGQFTCTDYSLTFGDASVQATHAAQPADPNEDLDLPTGIIDPRKALADIYAKRKAGKRAA